MRRNGYPLCLSCNILLKLKKGITTPMMSHILHQHPNVHANLSKKEKNKMEKREVYLKKVIQTSQELEPRIKFKPNQQLYVCGDHKLST